MKKFYDHIYNVAFIFCKLLFIVMIVITVYVVFGRYVLHSHPVWGEEVVLLSMTYMALISAALAIRDDSHMKMTVIEYVLPKKAVEVLKLIAFCSIFIFSIFMIVEGTKFTLTMRLSRLTGLRIATSWQYLSVPLAGLILMLMISEKLLETFGFIERSKTKAELDNEARLKADAAEQGPMGKKFIAGGDK